MEPPRLNGRARTQIFDARLLQGRRTGAGVGAADHPQGGIPCFLRTANCEVSICFVLSDAEYTGR